MPVTLEDVKTLISTTDLRTTLIGGARFPFIFNVTMTLANTEYSQQLPLETKKFLMKVRTEDSTFRVAWVPGLVAGSVSPFLTVLDGGIYSEDAVTLTNTIVYFACEDPGKVMEIVAWS
jgi:hypothetical protein